MIEVQSAEIWSKIVTSRAAIAAKNQRNNLFIYHFITLVYMFIVRQGRCPALDRSDTTVLPHFVGAGLQSLHTGTLNRTYNLLKYNWIKLVECHLTLQQKIGLQHIQGQQRQKVQESKRREPKMYMKCNSLLRYIHLHTFSTSSAHLVQEAGSIYLARRANLPAERAGEVGLVGTKPTDFI